MNKGVSLATGDIVGILNSDDFFTDNRVIERVVESFKNNDLDAVYGDIHFVNDNDLNKTVRYYSSRIFRPSLMRLGFMPAHPSFYVRRECYNKYGLFDLSYKIGADFELLLRFIKVNKIKIKYLNFDFVTMRNGGASTAGIGSNKQILLDIKRALKENVDKMQDIAVFSDDIREAVKGHYSDAKDKGFATGKSGNEETVKIGIVASTAHPQVNYKKGNNSKFPYASSPTQIINYVSCHDDLCLTDKLGISMEGASKEDRMEAAKLAQTIVFTSQGTPFMFAGEEIFRDKQGVHNSYKSPDSINAIDWNQKKDNKELFDYYRNLIALRKEHPAFRMTSAKDIAKNIVFDNVKEPNLISYSIKNNANGDSFKEIKLVFNGSDKAQKVKINKADWTVIAQDGKLHKDGLGKSNGGRSE